MTISRNNILYLLNKVASLLEEEGIHWWLSRGVLRNFYLTKEVGDKEFQSTPSSFNDLSF